MGGCPMRARSGGAPSSQRRLLIVLSGLAIAATTAIAPTPAFAGDHDVSGAELAEYQGYCKEIPARYKMIGQAGFRACAMEARSNICRSYKGYVLKPGQEGHRAKFNELVRRVSGCVRNGDGARSNYLDQ